MASGGTSGVVLPASTSAAEMLDRLLWLLEDEQLLEAQKQLALLRTAPDAAGVAARLEALGPRLEYLDRQAEEVRHAKSEFDTETGWVRVMRLFGISTYCQLKEGDRCIWVKMEGEMEGLSVLQLACVIREIDLFKTWIPFCSMSAILRWYSRANVFAQLAVSIPLFYRDAVVHAYACDTSNEDGSFMILGRSVDEEGEIEGEKLTHYTGHPFSTTVPDSGEGGGEGGVESSQQAQQQQQAGDPIPVLNTRASFGTTARMTIKAVRAQFTMLSATKVRACVVACVDPKVFVPMAIINFGMKNVCGVLLGLMASTARRIQNNPKRSKHFPRIIDDEDGFYNDWLWPKCQRFYQKMGWPQDEALALLLKLDSGSPADPFAASSTSEEINGAAGKKPLKKSPKKRKKSAGSSSVCGDNDDAALSTIDKFLIGLSVFLATLLSFLSYVLLSA